MLIMEDNAVHQAARATAKPDRIRLFLVDSHELERIGMRIVLEEAGDVAIIGEERTWELAAPKIERSRPDVVVMDLSTPQAEHPELLKEIFEVCRDRRVLFMAHRFKESTLAAVVRAGTHGCMLKNVSSEELVRAVHSITEGHRVIDPRLTEILFGLVRDIREGRKKKTPLSAQERRLLPLLAQGLTNKEIAREMNLSDKTVKNYLVNIYKKLNISRRSQAAAIHSRNEALEQSYLPTGSSAGSSDGQDSSRSI